jgi:hypothetical protein
MFSRFSPIHRHEHGADRVVGGTVLAHQYNDNETYEMTLQDKTHIVLLVLKLAEPSRDRFVVKSCKCQDPDYRTLQPGDILRSCHSTTSNGRKTMKEMRKVSVQCSTITEVLAITIGSSNRSSSRRWRCCD